MSNHRAKAAEAFITHRLAERGIFERIHLPSESEQETARFREAFRSAVQAEPQATVFLTVSMLAGELILHGFDPYQGPDADSPEMTRVTVFDPAMKALHLLPDDANHVWEIVSGLY
jgi:hypothetical protein